MKVVPLVALIVSRDANTRLPVTVPAHEVEVVQKIFGEDNVQITNEDFGQVEVEPSEEGDRLAQKYGVEPVERIYGDNFKGAVARKCEEIAKPSKAKA